MPKTTEAPEETPDLVASTLVDLAEKSNGKLPEGMRVYAVVSSFVGKPGDPTYVISNSPGNACQAVCAVERVSDKAFVTAAFQALERLHKQNGASK